MCMSDMKKRFNTVINQTMPGGIRLFTAFEGCFVPILAPLHVCQVANLTVSH
jgi:hypothetical protein